ncbi:DNase I-like protein [Rhizopus microsporus var. microsporus]|uniref:DNase I-like protein n=1 Tax=Rhizopus microsporus var. microsporus TaxID=86635 RepID=A0A1X0QVP0_RHIZD|nr:DNase I-like protein [Rhizopus microsporus var. microsporus]
MPEDTQELKILSFNCWCLPIVSKHKSARLAAIAKILSNGYYDIVALQEIWVYSDFEFLRKNIKHVFPFAKYFHSGVFGSGLAVFSKFPIISSSFYPFILNGKPLQVFHGDYYVGKGVGTVRLNHPQLGYLDVFNTHLHAGYGDRYKAHRAAQCWQLANLLRSFVIAGNHVVMTGDLNSISDSLNYRLIRDHSLLTDSWTQTYDPGFTCNSPFNTFSRYYKKDNVAAGKRLDYILYSRTFRLECIKSEVVMKDVIPGTNISYSDHFGVSAVFHIVNRSEKMDISGHLQSSTVDALIQLLEQELVVAKCDAKKHIFCVMACIFILLIFIILTILLPTQFRLTIYGYLATILTPLFCGLCMIIISIIGSFCLVIGLVFGRTEQNSMREMIDEIKLFKGTLAS